MEPESSQHLGLIPNPDLPKLNPGPKDRGQILDQFPKVDASIGCKIEDPLFRSKVYSTSIQLHGQPMVCYFF